MSDLVRNPNCWFSHTTVHILSIYSLHCKEEELKNRQTELSSLSEQLNVERIKQQQQADFIKRLQRKLLLITKVNCTYSTRLLYSYTIDKPIYD